MPGRVARRESAAPGREFTTLPARVLPCGLGLSVRPPGGCELLVQAPHVALASFALDGDGRGNLAIDVPLSTPVASVFVQAVSVDPSGGNGAYTTSNGIEVRVR